MVEMLILFHLTQFTYFKLYIVISRFFLSLKEIIFALRVTLNQSIFFFHSLCQKGFIGPDGRRYFYASAILANVVKISVIVALS